MIVHYITKYDGKETTVWDEEYQAFLSMKMPRLKTKPIKGKTIQFFRYGG